MRGVFLDKLTHMICRTIRNIFVKREDVMQQMIKTANVNYRISDTKAWEFIANSLIRNNSEHLHHIRHFQKI